jgi:hypothetical protein
MSRLAAIIGGLTVCAVLTDGRPALAQTATTGESRILSDAIDAYQSAMGASNRAERMQRFRQAELLFEQLVRKASQSDGGKLGRMSPDLLVDWGNAALGGEQVGTAILAYRRALRIDPDHVRALQNLRHARGLLPEWVPRPEERGFLASFWSWTTRLSHDECRTWSGGMFLVFALLVAASIRWRRPFLRVVAIVPAIAWISLVAMLLIHFEKSEEGVITSPEVVGRAADSLNAPARFAQPLPAGTEVTTVARQDDWRRVQLADGRDAWIPASAVSDIE